VEAGPLADGASVLPHGTAADPAPGVIIYMRGEWKVFIANARDGEFDFFAS
jgi:hypothetical protein